MHPSPPAPAVTDREAALRRAAQTLALFEEARAAVEALEREGIAAVALKGLSLHARGLYASPAERVMNDVDLLVRPADAARAWTTLEALGYAPHHPILLAHPGRAAAYRSAAGDLNFIHRERPRAWIDLHWNLARCDRFKGSLRMSAEALVDAARPAEGAGFPVRIPSLEHEIVYLAAHYALFNRRMARQTLSDIERLVRHGGWRRTEETRKHVEDLARRWGVLRAFRWTIRDLSEIAVSRVGATATSRPVQPPGEGRDLPPSPSASALRSPFGATTADSDIMGEGGSAIHAVAPTLLHRSEGAEVPPTPGWFYEAGMLDTWRDRIRWAGRTLLPGRDWLVFAYGRPSLGRHLLALARRAMN